MLGSWIRRTGFWTLDALRGGTIKKYQKHLKNVFDSEQGDDDALYNLLSYASNHVPFYHNISPESIKNFPVVTKQNYRENFEGFRSDEFLDENKLHKVYTSGSSGTPFMAYQNADKLKWHQAGLININNNIGWQLGDRFLFMRSWGIDHSSSKMKLWLSNTIPSSVMDFDDKRKEELRQLLIKDKTLYHILGYASALESLSLYLMEKGTTPAKLGIKTVIADSENLTSTAKATIEKAFGCPVLNRYGNNENGIIALTGAHDDAMYINYPEYYVEVLKTNSDEPAEEGECGRIVLTDLYNYAFPFIRYDTGDLGVASKVKNGQCFVIGQFMGRISASLTDTKGNLLGEAIITAFFDDLFEVGRWQIAQVGEKQYEVRLEQASEQQESVIIEKALRCFGEDAEVQIQHVEQIKQGKNGKYAVVVNEFKNKK